MTGFGIVRRWGLLLGASLFACGGAYSSDPVGAAGSRPPSVGEASTTVGGVGEGTSVGAGGSGGAGGATTIGAGGGPAIDPEPCPCTRRPGPGLSIRCAVGIDETASMNIGVTGGKITLTGQQGSDSGVPFSIAIKPKTVPEEVTVRVTETSLAPPSEFFDYSPIYLVEPADLLSTIPMSLVIPYGNKDGTTAAGLAIYRASAPSGPFVRVSDSYVNAGFMQGSVLEFGYFFAGAPKPFGSTVCP